MASFDVLDSRTVAVEVLIPVPVIIYQGMKLEDWKECFIQKKNEAATTAEALNYNECLKTLLYAELCNAALVKVGISRPNNNLAFKFTFKFSDSDCLEVFRENLKMVAVVSKVL